MNLSLPPLQQWSGPCLNNFSKPNCSSTPVANARSQTYPRFTHRGLFRGTLSPLVSRVSCRSSALSVFGRWFTLSSPGSQKRESDFRWLADNLRDGKL